MPLLCCTLQHVSIFHCITMLMLTSNKAQVPGGPAMNWKYTVICVSVSFYHAESISYIIKLFDKAVFKPLPAVCSFVGALVSFTVKVSKNVYHITPSAHAVHMHPHTSGGKTFHYKQNPNLLTKTFQTHKPSNHLVFEVVTMQNETYWPAIGGWLFIVWTHSSNW